MKTHVVMTGRERLFAALNGESSDHVPMWLLFPYHPTGYYVNVQTAPGYRDIFETSKTQAITLNRRNLGVLISIKDSADEIGHIGRIPVRNLWLLMLYASDLFRQINNTEKKSVEDNPDEIPDLIEEILSRQVKRRLKRNLSFGYQSREAILGRIRGSINLLNTERHQLLDRGKVACRFDELTVNTPRNCYVRTALEEIAKIVRSDELTRQCRLLAASLRRIGVIGEKPEHTEISVDRFGRHDIDDQLMVSAAHTTLTGLSNKAL